MKGGLGNLMKQAQEMQTNMQKAQEQLGQLEVTGESGGGMIKITMTGKHTVKKVLIDDSIIGDDKEMLEDLIAAAFNNAVEKIAKETENQFTGMLSGVSLPDGFKLPF